jgi:carboxymethylenebutenolidase
MKKLALIFALFLIPVLSIAQNKRSCCQAATQEFAMLGKKADFRSEHDTPEPLAFTPSLGSDISFAVPGGVNGRGYAVMADTPTDNYLLVFHEWWGLNNYIRRECERLSLMLDGVNIIAVDLYDGKTTDNRETAAKLMQGVDEKRAANIVKGAVAHAGPSARIQTIGWCFGGGWSLQASMIAGGQTIGCVMYYGMPEKEESKLKSINYPVLGIFASKDGWINQEVVGEFEKKMNELSKDITMKWYDAEHAFANPSNPQYDSEATADANKLAVEFLRGNFSK